ncbi:hypothetical protein [Streptomyces sp. NPDC057199]|uniref:hypothetical protein n=1 Tax=Streptomyces sp. NPDC057199 TaxID=3346047 RepID=UPI003640BB9F
MSPWEIALIAVGSAIAGGLPVAWFTRPMRVKATSETQPLAADLVRLITGDGRVQREREARRPAYLDFLVRVDAALGLVDPVGASTLEERRAVSSALDVLVLVGPSDAVEAAQHLAALAQRDDWRLSREVGEARAAFLTSARSALGPLSVDTGRLPDRPAVRQLTE